eukprot:CAMPEP_0197861244 /NCGR_PEP_ID=MMETSP1438-20131217/37155_1 /TAXON_ID=1461541 /ORGANISM="Pterosperma sp., Strain CCMP1384" /LENGTH=791 /DNA_ID=CAMNT_0043478351 /DNA_START=91 /DNA_END=2466 /DNA_ORIENTATION=+
MVAGMLIAPNRAPIKQPMSKYIPIAPRPTSAPGTEGQGSDTIPEGGDSTDKSQQPRPVKKRPLVATENQVQGNDRNTRQCTEGSQLAPGYVPVYPTVAPAHELANQAVVRSQVPGAKQLLPASRSPRSGVPKDGLRAIKPLQPQPQEVHWTPMATSAPGGQPVPVHVKTPAAPVYAGNPAAPPTYPPNAALAAPAPVIPHPGRVVAPTPTVQVASNATYAPPDVKPNVQASAHAPPANNTEHLFVIDVPQLQQAYCSSGDAVFVADAEHRILWANTAYNQLVMAEQQREHLGTDKGSPRPVPVPASEYLFKGTDGHTCRAVLWTVVRVPAGYDTPARGPQQAPRVPDQKPVIVPKPEPTNLVAPVPQHQAPLAPSQAQTLPLPPRQHTPIAPANPVAGQAAPPPHPTPSAPHHQTHAPAPGHYVAPKAPLAAPTQQPPPQPAAHAPAPQMDQKPAVAQAQPVNPHPHPMYTYPGGAVPSATAHPLPQATNPFSAGIPPQYQYLIPGLVPNAPHVSPTEAATFFAALIAGLSGQAQQGTTGLPPQAPAGQPSAVPTPPPGSSPQQHPSQPAAIPPPVPHMHTPGPTPYHSVAPAPVASQPSAPAPHHPPEVSHRMYHHQPPAHQPQAPPPQQQQSPAPESHPVPPRAPGPVRPKATRARPMPMPSQGFERSGPSDKRMGPPSDVPKAEGRYHVEAVTHPGYPTTKGVASAPDHPHPAIAQELYDHKPVILPGYPMQSESVAPGPEAPGARTNAQSKGKKPHDAHLCSSQLTRVASERTLEASELLANLRSVI